MLEVVGILAILAVVLVVGSVVASEMEYQIRNWLDVRYCRTCVDARRDPSG